MSEACSDCIKTKADGYEWCPRHTKMFMDHREELMQKLEQAKNRIKELEQGIEDLYVERNDAGAKLQAANGRIESQKIEMIDILRGVRALLTPNHSIPPRKEYVWKRIMAWLILNDPPQNEVNNPERKGE